MKTATQGLIAGLLVMAVAVIAVANDSYGSMHLFECLTQTCVYADVRTWEQTSLVWPAGLFWLGAALSIMGLIGVVTSG